MHVTFTEKSNGSFDPCRRCFPVHPQGKHFTDEDILSFQSARWLIKTEEAKKSLNLVTCHIDWKCAINTPALSWLLMRSKANLYFGVRSAAQGYAESERMLSEDWEENVKCRLTQGSTINSVLSDTMRVTKLQMLDLRGIFFVIASLSAGSFQRNLT